MAKYDSNWWLGPNSLFGTALSQSVYGKDGGGVKGKKTVKDWFGDLFKGTGITVTAGVSPDDQFSDQIKVVGGLVLLYVLLIR